MKKNTLSRILAAALTGSMLIAALTGCAAAPAPAAAPAAEAVQEAAEEVKEEAAEEAEEVAEAVEEAAEEAAEAVEEAVEEVKEAPGISTNTEYDLEAGTLKAIRDRGVLTVATEPYFAPEEFIDPSLTGQEQYVGSDMELAKKIAEKIGVELEIVPLEFTAVISSVAEGKYDLAISALAYSPARAEAVELSKGYYFSEDDTGYGLLIRKEHEGIINNAEDLADYVVITQSGSVQEAFVMDQVPNYKEFKKVSSMNDAFLAVQEGKADAAAVAIANAQLYVDSNPDCGMMIVPDFKFYVDPIFSGVRLAAKKGNIDLIALCNEVIAENLEQYAIWYDEYSEYAKELGID